MPSWCEKWCHWVLHCVYLASIIHPGPLFITQQLHYLLTFWIIGCRIIQPGRLKSRSLLQTHLYDRENLHCIVCLFSKDCRCGDWMGKLFSSCIYARENSCCSLFVLFVSSTNQLQGTNPKETALGVGGQSVWRQKAYIRTAPPAYIPELSILWISQGPLHRKGGLADNCTRMLEFYLSSFLTDWQR